VELDGRGAAKVCHGGDFKTDVSSTANVRSADASRMLHCDRNPPWIFSIFIRFLAAVLSKMRLSATLSAGSSGATRPIS
jgi:hypothetical protein